MSDPVAYVRIAEGEPLPCLGVPKPFRTVIVAESSASTEWKDQVADWLVRQGCLYVLCAGQNVLAWHDAVDWANITAFEPNPVPDAAHVMTTWHEGETLDEVFWFAGFGAQHGHVDLLATVIVHVSATDARAELLDRFEAARHLDS